VKEMKKILLVIYGIMLLMALSSATVLAGPTSPPDYGKYNPHNLLAPPEDWGVEKVLPSHAPGGQTHIITDPLVGSDANGWVTFWCQSKIGFQYNIGTYSGLNPLSKYSVRAHGVKIQIVPAGTPGGIDTHEGFWIDPTTLTVIEPLELGAFRTDANGLGGVKGVVKLQSGWLYDVGTVVSDIDGHSVLWSPADDTNGFIVY